MVLLVGFVAVGAYLLPALVAHWRHHPQENQVFILNLLLGWTLIGWAVALIWAVREYGERPTTPAPNRPARVQGWSDGGLDWDARKPQERRGTPPT